MLPRTRTPVSSPSCMVNPITGPSQHNTDRVTWCTPLGPNHKGILWSSTLVLTPLAAGCWWSCLQCDLEAHMEENRVSPGLGPSTYAWCWVPVPGLKHPILGIPGGSSNVKTKSSVSAPLLEMHVGSCPLFLLMNLVVQTHLTWENKDRNVCVDVKTVTTFWNIGRLHFFLSHSIKV